MLTDSDKTTLTKYPPLPSKCVICLRDSNGELNFIDFQMSVDVYGAVVICVDCFAPVAQLLGYVSIETAEDSLNQMRSLVETNRELYENNAKLNATIDILLNLRPDIANRYLSVNESTVENSVEDDSESGNDTSKSGTDD